MIVSGDEDGKVRVWELSTEHLISGPHQVPDLDGGITAAAFIPSWDGGRLALAGKKRVRRGDPDPESSSRVVFTAERRIVLTRAPNPGLTIPRTPRPAPAAPEGPGGAVRRRRAAAADRAARHPPGRRAAPGQRRAQHGRGGRH